MHLRSIWRRVGVAFASVAACLYLPFSWLLLASGSDRLVLQWIWLWPIFPGFIPGAYVFHQNNAVKFSVMGVTSIGLLAILTCLGTSSRRRFWIAIGLTLLISVPTSIIAYASFRF